MKPTDAPLLWERGMARLAGQFRQHRVPFLSAFFGGLLAYGYAFLNKLPNHDEITCLFSKGATYESGRWGLKILEKFLPSYSMPWLYGILTLVLMAAAACVIVRLSGVKNPFLQGLLAGCVTVFPSLTAAFGYMFTASAYGVAFLLAVLALWVLENGPRKGWIFALGGMVFSLSLYQSYIAVTAGLMLLCLIRRLLEEEDVLAVVRRGVGYLGFLILSLALYFVGTTVINRLRGASFGDYAAGGMNLSLSAIPSGIVMAYTAFAELFTRGLHGMFNTPYLRFVNGAVLALTLALLPVVLMGRKGDWGRIALLLALVLLLPLAVNCMYLIMAPESIHAMVLHGFVVFYALAAMLTELALPMKAKFPQILTHGMSLGLILILAANIYTANRVSLYLQLQYENTYAFYTGLASDLKNTPDFDENTKLAVIGFYQRPEYFEEQFADLNALPGVGALHPDVYSKARFLEYYLGLKIPFASDDEIAEIAASEEFAAMAEYPYYGCMKRMGDTLVVKLS